MLKFKQFIFMITQQYLKNLSDNLFNEKEDILTSHQIERLSAGEYSQLLNETKEALQKYYERTKVSRNDITLSLYQESLVKLLEENKDKIIINKKEKKK